jgi:hypothetical protein
VIGQCSVGKNEKSQARRARKAAAMTAQRQDAVCTATPWDDPASLHECGALPSTPSGQNSRPKARRLGDNVFGDSRLADFHRAAGVRFGKSVPAIAQYLMRDRTASARISRNGQDVRLPPSIAHRRGPADGRREDAGRWFVGNVEYRQLAGGCRCIMVAFAGRRSHAGWRDAVWKAAGRARME